MFDYSCTMFIVRIYSHNSPRGALSTTGLQQLLASWDNRITAKFSFEEVYVHENDLRGHK
jgi:hypothetical protein